MRNRTKKCIVLLLAILLLCLCVWRLTPRTFGQMTGARRLPGGSTYFFRDVRSAAEKGRFFQKLQTLFVDQDFPIGRIKPVLVLSHRRCEHTGSGRGRFGQTIIDFKGNGFIGDHTGIGI